MSEEDSDEDDDDDYDSEAEGEKHAQLQPCVTALLFSAAEPLCELRLPQISRRQNIKFTPVKDSFNWKKYNFTILILYHMRKQHLAQRVTFSFKSSLDSWK